MENNKYFADGKRFVSLSSELKKEYGRPIKKLVLDGGFTCPNRDGTKGSRGCIFCSEGGSGDFTCGRDITITNQIEKQIQEKEGKIKEGKQFQTEKNFISNKENNSIFQAAFNTSTPEAAVNKSISKLTAEQKMAADTGYIAYFQAFTGTYDSVDRLRSLYMEAANHERVCIISIATRPDCLSDEILDLLEEINEIKPVWVELGLQTMHEASAVWMRRGYDNSVFETAVYELSLRKIRTIVHLILGLPMENEKMVLQTIHYLNRFPVWGVKLQLLHILKNTDLEKEYVAGKVRTLEEKEYVQLTALCIAHLRRDLVIHRITGDGPKDILAAPLWSRNKKKILNEINHELKEKDLWQGKLEAQNME